MWPRSPPKTLGSCASMCLHAARTQKRRGIAFFRIVPVSSATRPLAVRTHSAIRLNPDAIVDGVANPLLAAKVSLGCLY